MILKNYRVQDCCETCQHKLLKGHFLSGNYCNLDESFKKQYLSLLAGEELYEKISWLENHTINNGCICDDYQSRYA
jgi:hypothetical protein